MTNRERMLATLRHEQPDRTPYHLDFTIPAAKKMAAALGDENFSEKLGNAWASAAVDGGHWREVAPGIWEDGFGVRWDRRADPNIGVVVNRAVTPETLAEYRFPTPEVANPPGYTGDRMVYIDLGFSLFERAWTLTGMENLLAAMIDDPDFANALFDRILEYNLRAIDLACAQVMDCMRFGDDWGQQTGILMGPVLWREYIKPRIAQMYARVKQHGKILMIHSCGKVDSLFPDLIELGLDIFNPFQPEVIDVEAAKRVYGDRLTFFGGISTQRTLPYATPQQTRDEVRRLLDVVGKNGGYIAAPAHAIPADAKVDNILAMIEVLQNQ